MSLFLHFKSRDYATFIAAVLVCISNIKEWRHYLLRTEALKQRAIRKISLSLRPYQFLMIEDGNITYNNKQVKP